MFQDALGGATKAKAMLYLCPRDLGWIDKGRGWEWDKLLLNAVEWDATFFTPFITEVGTELRKEILLLDAQGFASTWKGTDATCWGRRRRCDGWNLSISFDDINILQQICTDRTSAAIMTCPNKPLNILGSILHPPITRRHTGMTEPESLRQSYLTLHQLLVPWPFALDLLQSFATLVAGLSGNFWAVSPNPLLNDGFGWEFLNSAPLIGDSIHPWVPSGFSIFL